MFTPNRTVNWQHDKHQFDTVIYLAIAVISKISNNSAVGKSCTAFGPSTNQMLTLKGLT